MDLHGRLSIVDALTLVGELLKAEGRSYAVTILGGAALNLLGIVDRTTDDVDILAFATPRPGRPPAPETLHEQPTPIPEPLVRAARTVARDLGIDAAWLNTGPAVSGGPASRRGSPSASSGADTARSGSGSSPDSI
jgi:hypothetical protein